MDIEISTMYSTTSKTKTSKTYLAPFTAGGKTGNRTDPLNDFLFFVGVIFAIYLTRHLAGKAVSFRSICHDSIQ